MNGAITSMGDNTVSRTRRRHPRPSHRLITVPPPPCPCPPCLLPGLVDGSSITPPVPTDLACCQTGQGYQMDKEGIFVNCHLLPPECSYVFFMVSVRQGNLQMTGAGMKVADGKKELNVFPKPIAMRRRVFSGGWSNGLGRALAAVTALAALNLRAGVAFAEDVSPVQVGGLSLRTAPRSLLLSLMSAVPPLRLAAGRQVHRNRAAQHADREHHGCRAHPGATTHVPTDLDAPDHLGHPGRRRVSPTPVACLRGSAASWAAGLN